MNSNDFDYIHQVLDLYRQTPTSPIIKDKPLTKRELTSIFQTMNEALQQPDPDLTSLSLKGIEKRVQYIETIEKDIEVLYNQYLHNSLPKYPSKSRQAVKKVWKAFAAIFPFLQRSKKQLSFNKTYGQLKENLNRIHSQLIASRDSKERFTSLANKWRELVSQPGKVSLREAKETFDQLLLSLNRLLDSSEQETTRLIKDYPELCTFFSKDIHLQLNDLMTARAKNQPIASFALDPFLGKKIARLLGEEESDYKEIPIRSNVIQERLFLNPTSHPGFWKLKASDSIFLSIYDELKKVFCPSKKEEMQCRGLFIELILTQEGQEKICLKRILKLARKSPLSFFSLSFNRPIHLTLPPLGLDSDKRKEFFATLAKIEIKSPIALKVAGPLSLEEEDYLNQLLPHVSELDVSHQSIEWIRHVLPSMKELQKLSLKGTKVTDLDLAKWQYQGCFNQLKELVLRECSHVTSHLYFPLLTLLRHTPQLVAHFPSSLPKGDDPLPKGDDAIRLQAFLVRSGKDDNVYPDEKDLSSSSLALWLELNNQTPLPSNPYVTTINAHNLSTLTNAQFVEILRKFPAVKEINLKGCTQLTDDVFLDPIVQTWLKEKRFLNLRGTRISKEVQAQIQERFPSLTLADVTINVRGKEFEFNQKQLMQISPYWNNQFSQDGMLYQQDYFSLEDTHQSSFDPEVFASVAEYVKDGTFTKGVFSYEEAKQFLILSEFFGKDFYTQCLNVLAYQIYLSTTSSDDLTWIQNLAEEYSENGLVEMCKHQMPIAKYASKKSPIESFMSPTGSMNLIISNHSQDEPLSLIVKPEILAKHSPVFEAMFRWEKERGNRNQLFIQEDPTTFLALCQWMQTQTIPSWDQLPRVIKLADQYLISKEVLSRKETLEFLLNNLETEMLNVDTIELLLHERIEGNISEESNQQVVKSLVKFIEKEPFDFDNGVLILQLMDTYKLDKSTLLEHFSSKKVQQFLIRMAEKGNVTAQVILGWCYYYGYGGKLDLKKVKELYDLATQQGNIVAQDLLGWCYYYGLGGERLLQNVRKLFQNATKRGVAPSPTQIDLELLDSIGWSSQYDGSREEITKSFQIAAKQGYAPAQNALGDLYFLGIAGTLSKDLIKARKCFQLAADQGLATAQCNLALCYEWGYGGEIDFKKAKELYQLAADQGLVTAQCSLGLYYERGHGVEVDLKKAREFYQLAADQGNILAQYKLSEFYRKGLGGEQNLEKAQEIYQYMRNQTRGYGVDGQILHKVKKHGWQKPFKNFFSPS